MREIFTKFMFNFLSRYHIHMLYVLQFVTARASFKLADENACLPKKSFFFARRITLMTKTFIKNLHWNIFLLENFLPILAYCGDKYKHFYKFRCFISGSLRFWFASDKSRSRYGRTAKKSGKVSAWYKKCKWKEV